MMPPSLPSARERRSEHERTRGKSSALKAFALSATAVVLVLGAEMLVDGSRRDVIAASLPSTGYGPANFGAELAASDRQLSLATERIAFADQEWLRHEAFARAALGRFKLNADPEMLALASESVARATALAPDGSGPMLTSAEIAMAQHDLEQAESFLDVFEQFVVSPGQAATATAVALRGDIAFYRGDMASAERLYREADSIIPTPGTAIRQSLLARSQGEFDQAITLIGEAARRDNLRTPRSMSAYALQIGMIESARGNFAAAAQSYADADSLFPGHWLVQYYQAEARAMADELVPAIAIFERMARENGDPQAMDAAAALHIANGENELGKQWSERAAVEWNARLEAMPLVYTAHAFENAVAFGDPQRALLLARNNLAKRPYGDAHILMAEAMLANGRPADARTHLLEAERQGWRSAPLYARLSEAEELLGDRAASRSAKRKAEQLNPQIFSPDVGRLWFGHG